MPAKRPTVAFPAANLALYEQLLATVPGIERQGATVPYTSLNGRMFSYLDKSSALFLRLPPEARAAFVGKYQTAPAVSYGVVMKDYVAVPAALLANTSELQPYFELAVAYARTLKARPTKQAAAKKSGTAKAKRSTQTAAVKKGGARKPAKK